MGSISCLKMVGLCSRAFISRGALFPLIAVRFYVLLVQ